LDYYWRNVDPLDGGGQFCDRGYAYKPAIFYTGDDERLAAEQSTAAIQALHPEWSLQVPLVKLDKFWPDTGGTHQNYYINNPDSYKYYKGRCGRVNRLEAVWGDEEYSQYHDPYPGATNVTVTNAFMQKVPAMLNGDATHSGSSSLPALILWPTGLLLLSFYAGF
jgi:hypothetical protein